MVSAKTFNGENRWGFGLREGCPSHPFSVDEWEGSEMTPINDAAQPNPLHPDDQKVFEIFREIQDQYRDYISITAQSGVSQSWAEVPADPSDNAPLSLVVWQDVQQ